MKDRPDMILVLAAILGIGVFLTVILPISSGSTVAAPASPLQAGILESR